MSGWDWFVHAANILYLISYLVKDLFVLRFVLMIAMIVFLPFYIWSGEEPMWSVLAWQAIFMTVNGIQLYRLFKERRPVVLSAEDDAIYHKSFTSFTIKQFAKLLQTSQRKSVNPEETLFEVGSSVDRIVFITEGGAHIEKDGELLMELNEGDLVADVNYITDSPVTYKVIPKEKAQILYWDKDAFEKTISSDPGINSSWQSLISRRLAQKLAKN